MSTFEAIVLGIVQGFTEFLPISSTAHLRIVPAFAGWEDPGTAFTAVIQLGTVLAVVVYFRHDLWNITRAWLASLRDPSRRGEQDAKMGWYLIAGTIPIAVIGFAFSDTIESKTRDLYLIGTTLIALGLVLLAAEKLSKHERKLESTTMRDAVAIGFGQAAALIPGVSRSGSTITVGLFLGFDREAAARLSFLLSVPAVVLSGHLPAGRRPRRRSEHRDPPHLDVLRVPLRLSGHRRVAALPGKPHDDRVRGLPGGPRRAGDRARRRRSHRIAVLGFGP